MASQVLSCRILIWMEKPLKQNLNNDGALKLSVEVRGLLPNLTAFVLYLQTHICEAD